MSYKNVDLKLTFVFFCLVVLSICYVNYQDEVKLVVKSFLEWPHLNIAMWLAVSVSFVIHYMSVKNSGDTYEGLIYKTFGKFADSAFAAITYGLALTTSSSILKGVYIQQIIGGDIYFNHFNELDIYSMLVVCVFLFGYSIYATSDALLGAIFRSTSEKAEPTV